MASWLKAAEDLFEVVDRRAKLVVGELSDELPLPASNGQGSQTKRKKSKPKLQKRPSTNESPIESDASEKLTIKEAPQSSRTSDSDKPTLSVENEGIPTDDSIAQTSSDQKDGFERDKSSIPSLEMQENEVVKHDVDNVEVLVTASKEEDSASTSNGQLLDDKSPVVTLEHSFPASADKEIEVVEEGHGLDTNQNVELRDTEVPSEIIQERSETGEIDPSDDIGTQLKDVDSKVDPIVHQKKQEDLNSDDSHLSNNKSDSSPTKILDPLEEAEGLIKNAISTGQSKEARLSRACAGLRNRLKEYKSENEQLEELLLAERELCKSYETRIKQLQQDLSLSKSEVTRVESNMLEALTAKNSEINALVNSMDALKKEAALSEGKLASLQANMESILRNRELTETRMMQALREELASAERRAEEERAAHNATKKAAMEREVELEHRAIEASTALARTQRIADERTAKAAELEQKLALLEVECTTLNQELQDMEARARLAQKKSQEETNPAIQGQTMQAWQEEVERARQGQRDAESKSSSLQTELQKMKVEMAAMKRDAEHYSRQEHIELEKRYRELTDLLYHKQTQLEAMASEKAAAEFQLEKEVKRLQEAQVEAERSRVSRRPSSSWEDDTEMKALEPLPLYHRRMAGANIQLEKAAKMLDTGAARATRFLWRYPKARLLLLFYLVFVHLFLMYLLHRLQKQADDFSAREVAHSMGLTNPNLP